MDVCPLPRSITVADDSTMAKTFFARPQCGLIERRSGKTTHH